MIFTKSAISENALSVVEQIANDSAGVRIPEIISTISQKLHNVFATGSKNNPYNLGSDVEMEDISDDEGENEGSESDGEPPFGIYDSDEGIDDWNTGLSNGTKSGSYKLGPEMTAQLNRQIKQDLLTARMAGFKIGILSGMRADSQNSVVSISIQVSKLGMSEEAIQAWDLEQQQYIVLLIRYTEGYKTFKSIIEEAAKTNGVEFRIGVSNKYKPAVEEALLAFSDSAKADRRSSDSQTTGESEKKRAKTVTGFFNLFISSSLNEFVNTQFVSLLKIRDNTALGWEAAKKFFDDKQGRPLEKISDIPLEYDPEPPSTNSNLPDFVTADHLTDHHRDQNVSFPLIAAQFALRYLVRCTEYCLVCHTRIQGDFEALKPYVCDRPLCLYQYMSLGFGPSVEHELQTQPYVVDLLVSLCYASAVVS